MNRSTRSLLIVFVIALLIFTLISCIPIMSIEYSLKIGLRENWNIEAIVVPMAGLEDQLINEFNSSAFHEKYMVLGIDTTVETLPPLSDGSIPIKLGMRGRGYDSLNQVLGEQAITIDTSNIQHTIHFNSNMSQQPGIQSASFTLSGGTILDHNGTLVDRTTVNWSNYSGSMYAAMKEPSLLDYLPYIAIGCICLTGAIVIVLITLGLSRSKKKTEEIISAKQSPALQKSCNRCGSTMPVNADFCPMCGGRQN